MKKITHEDQQQFWDAEHGAPTVLLQMDSKEASGGVIKFWQFLEKIPGVKAGIEMGCGKGRNVIWLAQQKTVASMAGFDFSKNAIREATIRAKEADISSKVSLFTADATLLWPYKSESFDFGIDCFASTDIESREGRDQAVAEMYRVLKAGGYFLVYALSPEDAFHKEMIERSPAHEPNAFYHPTGKFEKTFTEEELQELYKNFKVIAWERVDKNATFFGKEYGCKHFWIILQKQDP
jgi:ubiquinone/menaquinone biosynthesis C-methylase UbiE